MKYYYNHNSHIYINTRLSKYYDNIFFAVKGLSTYQEKPDISNRPRIFVGTLAGSGQVFPGMFRRYSCLGEILL